MNDQGLGTDSTNFGESIAECESTLEEPILIRRFSGQTTTPGAFGTTQKPTPTDIPSTAVVVEMGVAAKMFAAGILSVGDLVLQMRDRILEGNENIGGSVFADRVVYRGMEYRMVQRPIPESFGGGLSEDVPFWTVHLRRTNSTADQVGR